VIVKTQSFQSSNGKIFGSIAEAQKEEVALILQEPLSSITPASVAAILDAILSNSEKIVDVLTTKGSSRPKARTANGATRKKKSKEVLLAPTAG